MPGNVAKDHENALVERKFGVPLGAHVFVDLRHLPVDETIDAIAHATGRTVLRIPLTKTLAKAALDHVPGVYRVMRIPSAAVDYFVHPTLYDTTNTQRDLHTAVPRFRDYLPRLVEFVKAHPEIGPAAMA